MTLISIFVH